MAEMNIEEESDDKLYGIQDIKNVQEDCIDVVYIDAIDELIVILNTKCD